MKKGIKYGCLSVIGLVVLIFIAAYIEDVYFTTDEERAEWVMNEAVYRRNQQDSVTFLVNQISSRMSRANKALSLAILDTIPKKCKSCALVKKEDWTFQLTSEDELKQFSDSRITANPKLHWGPWLRKNMQLVVGNYNRYDSLSNSDLWEVKLAAREILTKRFLWTFIPIVHVQPRLIDSKYFEAGYFYGWVVLMNAETGEVLGHRIFHAVGTNQVESFQLKVGFGPLKIPVTGNNFKEKLDKDFQAAIDKAADEAFDFIVSE